MLRPCQRPVHGGQIRHCFANFHYAVGGQLDLALKIELRQRQMRLGDHPHARRFNLVRRDRRFAMHRHARCVLRIGRRAENIEAKIVPEDSSQQFTFGIVAVLRMAIRAIRRRLDRRPRRRPQGIHAGFSFDDFGNVAALAGNRDDQFVIFNPHDFSRCHFESTSNMPQLRPPVSTHRIPRTSSRT